MNKKIGAVVVILAIAAVGIFLWKGRDKKKPTTEPEVAETTKPPPLKAPQRDGAGKPQPAAQFLSGADPEGPLRLEGQVIEADGTPVGGAIVTLTSIPPRTAKTEDDGSFVFDKLIGKRYALSATEGDLFGGPVLANLSEKTDPVIIRVTRASSVEVTVVSAATDEPVSGATVTLSRIGERVETTDGNGVATFRGVGAGWHQVSAVAPGHAVESQNLAASMTPGQVIRARLALKPGVAVSGVVKNSDGKTVSGAYVRVRDSSGVSSFLSGGAAKGRSDESGKFTLQGVEAGTVQVIANHPDYIPGQSEKISVGGSAVTDVEVTVESGVAIRGRVVDGSGAGAAWSTVRVAAQGNMFDPFASFTANREVHADKDGKFEFKAMPKASLNLVASDDNASSKPKPINLSDGKDEEGVELLLDVKGLIAGVVVRPSGKSVAEVQVRLFPDLLSGADADLVGFVGSKSSTTDGDGKFSFGGLPDGKYRIAANDGTAAENQMFAKNTSAETGDTDVRIVLTPNGSLKGTLVYNDGSPVKTFVVTIGWPPGTPVVSDDGKFEIENVTAGKHDVRFVGPEFAETTKADVVIEGEKATDIGSFTVKKGRSISGVVVDKGGSPVAGATILTSRQLIGDGKNLSLNVASDEIMRLRRATSDSSGRFRIRGVPEIELVVAAEHPEAGRSLPTDIAAGTDSAELKIALLPTGSLEGTITTGGKPAKGTNVLATSVLSVKQSVIAETDDDGKYLISKLTAGDYKITAMTGSGLGSVSAATSTTIEPDKRGVANIDIKQGELKLTVNVKGKGGAKIDAAQLFLFSGAVSAKNAKELTDAFMRNQGEGARMTFAFGPSGTFDKLTARTYTLCTLPINGDLSDPQFLQRIQDASDSLKVYCQRAEVSDSPAEQSIDVEVPPMDPLPNPEGQPGNAP